MGLDIAPMSRSRLGGELATVSIRVISHNAFWFQGAPSKTTDPDAVHDEIWPRLVSIYRGLKPDLLCLQEVHTPAVAARLAAELDASWLHTPGCRQPVYGGAVLWWPGATLSLRDFRTEHDWTPFRIWQWIEWRRGREALRLTHLHLPSNRVTGGAPIADTQCAEVRRYALDSAFVGDIVAGDFNASPRDAAPSVLAAAGYLDAAVLAGRDQAPTTMHGGRGDHLWLRSASQWQLRDYRVIDLSTPEYAPRDPAKKSLSDHYPLMIELERTDVSI